MYPLSTALKAAREIGIKPLWFYGIYRTKLWTGWYKRTFNPQKSAGQKDSLSLKEIFITPSPESIRDVLGDAGFDRLLEEANLIVEGKYFPFGGEPLPLNLKHGFPANHWSDYERDPTRYGIQTDIKLIWEPNRFGWAFALGRAYHITKDERFAEAFWEYFEDFLASNPPYLGPNWMSAQEVALRIIALVFMFHVLKPSIHSTQENMEKMTKSIADHAWRIPRTLDYSRAQNNNHLITEAVGIYTAGSVLTNHPKSEYWKKTGWDLFNWGIQNQIEANGTYTQQSTNYHRLMLQASLWMSAVAGANNEPFPNETTSKLVKATRWLYKLMNPDSGKVPNLGDNDGAQILPLSVGNFSDYRPVVHSVFKIFLNQDLPGSGPWKEPILWLDHNRSELKPSPEEVLAHPVLSPHSIPHPTLPARAYLRAVTLRGRPSHADQLHIDLWWKGLNLAVDPGTYLYSGDPPWDNSLTSTQVHNTVCVNRQDQMTRAGKFLYLDWAHARVVDFDLDAMGRISSLTAIHEGYRNINVVHKRKLSYVEGGFDIQDTLVQSKENEPAGKTIEATLHWLMPDLPYESHHILEENLVMYVFETEFGRVELEIEFPDNYSLRAGLVRAGNLVGGNCDFLPIHGWFSPTYNSKIPALSIIASTQTDEFPINLFSRWRVGV